MKKKQSTLTFFKATRFGNQLIQTFLKDFKEIHYEINVNIVLNLSFL